MPPTDSGLLLPSSDDSERVILGAALLDNVALTLSASIISPDDFLFAAHRKIYSRMLDMVASGDPVDLITIGNELGRNKELESVGGYAYLSSLTEGIPARANVQHHARIVRDKSNLRKIINACQGTIAVAMEQQLSAEHCAASLQDEIIAIQSRASTSTVKTAREFMPLVLQEMDAQKRHEGLVGLTTGVRGIDDRTTGIRPGELWVVGALPSRGKTAFGLGMAGDNLQNGLPTLVFSLEMSDRQLGRRLLANYSGVDAVKIRDPKWMSESEWPRVERTTKEIMEWPLYVDDASSITTREIAARARLYIRRHKVRLIVVDYLMLVDEPREKETRLKARRIANTFRQIAKDEDVAIVLLSQLSRPKDGNINSRPSMINLRESGDIEAAAHTVLLLYMPMGENEEPTGEEEIIIGKQREGWLGSVPVTYNRKRLRFYDRTGQEQQ